MGQRASFRTTQHLSRSQDYYWYSPVLRAALDGKTADIVVSPASEADCGVAETAAHVEDSSSVDIAEQAAFDLRPDPRSEVDRVEGTNDVGVARIMERHGGSLAAIPHDRVEGYSQAS